MAKKPEDPLAEYVIPRRYERVDLPEPYTGAWVEAWVNPPQSLFRAAPADGDDSELGAQLVRAWNLALEPGQPLPATAEGIQALPLDLRTVLWEAYHAQRLRPLVRPATPTSAAS